MGGGGGRLAARGNYVWYLAIVTKFKGLGGTNSHHMGMTSHKGDDG